MNVVARQEEVWMQGHRVRGLDLMAQLDKARRTHDAEAIMAFVLEAEGKAPPKVGVGGCLCLCVYTCMDGLMHIGYVSR
jgi:hypothetical protein